jgi:tetratricopeptide (TPR) repeat protein
LPVLNFARRMPDPSSQSEHVSDADSALLDAELFIKYQAPERAIKRLRAALEGNPRSIAVRERLREICIVQKQTEEAARQCVALARLYIEREEFDDAYDRLLEAKQLDARINIAGGLEAIRRARRPDLRPEANPVQKSGGPSVTLAGDLAAINIFDAIQVLENAKLTGTLLLSPDSNNSSHSGTIRFNEGRIVDAESAGSTGEQGFRKVCEITSGSFEFQKSAEGFVSRIQALSNTNLILDTLRQLDEARQ